MTKPAVIIKRLGGDLHTVSVWPPVCGFSKDYIAKDYAQALGYAVGIAGGLKLDLIDKANVA